LPESLGPASTIHCTGLDLASSKAVASSSAFPSGKRTYLFFSSSTTGGAFAEVVGAVGDAVGCGELGGLGGWLNMVLISFDLRLRGDPLQ
jgi:hypothetical protein